MQFLVCHAVAVLAVAEAAQAAEPAAAPARLSSWPLGLIALGMGLFLLGLTTLVLQFVLLLRTRPSPTAGQILRVGAITLILTGALLFVPAGFTVEQTAPVLVLLAVIAGFLLGTLRDRPPPAN